MLFLKDHICVYPANGTWVVRAGGGIIAESSQAMLLKEGEYPEVVYFPKEDVAMPFLEKTDKHSICPHKGEAGYYNVVGKNGIIENAAWSYDEPVKGLHEITGFISFYTHKAAVERL